MKRNPAILISLFALCALFLGGYFFTPTVQEVIKDSLGSDRIVLARDGQLLQSLRTDFTKRRLAWIPLSGFSAALKEAVLTSEDQRFHSHLGVDPVGLARA